MEKQTSSLLKVKFYFSSISLQWWRPSCKYFLWNSPLCFSSSYWQLYPGFDKLFLPRYIDIQRFLCRLTAIFRCRTVGKSVFFMQSIFPKFPLRVACWGIGERKRKLKMEWIWRCFVRFFKWFCFSFSCVLNICK